MKWVTRVSRALMMGLAWAAVWVPAGVVAARFIVGELDPEHIGGPLYAGVLCGTAFAAVAGIASGRRKLHELSFSQAALRGAVSGLLVGALPFVLGDGSGEGGPWYFWIALCSTLSLLGAVSALASVWLARRNRDSSPDVLRPAVGG